MNVSQAQFLQLNLLDYKRINLEITNAEWHFQFQTLHFVTHTDIKSKDTSLQYFFNSFLFKSKDSKDP